jgi:hypothetical protein
LKRSPIEPRLLWDADKLAHIGAFGMLVFLMNNIASDRVSQMQEDPEFAPSEGSLFYIWRKGIHRLDHGHKSADRFYFPLSRRIAKSQLKIQQAFIHSLKQQLCLDS